MKVGCLWVVPTDGGQNVAGFTCRRRALQAIAHMTGDWSRVPRKCREACCEKLASAFVESSMHEANRKLDRALATGDAKDVERACASLKRVADLLNFVASGAA